MSSPDCAASQKLSKRVIGKPVNSDNGSSGSPLAMFAYEPCTFAYVFSSSATHIRRMSTAHRANSGPSRVAGR